MSFSAEQLALRLADYESQLGTPRRLLLAYSGGLDSSVLLHALASLQSTGALPGSLLALHVNHGLQQDADLWQRHCENVASSLAVDIQCLSVSVNPDSGLGPEASARDARYTALRDQVTNGDWVLSAHHRDDQAETLLINLLRGSGPLGIAGIGELRPFGHGTLVRPLLEHSREELQTYAELHQLEFVEDTSNADTRFDRNYLRHEILPRLGQRWNDVAKRLQRSAMHAGEAAALLDELARIDLARLGGRPERLSIAGLNSLSEGRQRNVIRHALQNASLPLPSAQQLQRVIDELLAARHDAQPLVRWAGAAVRRYRDGLYLMPELPPAVMTSGPVTQEAVDLGPGLGRLAIRPHNAEGLDPHLLRSGLRLQRRQGGEQIRPKGQLHTKKLKKLLQESGVVPWMRDRLPLVYAGERLVAVADLWMADDAVANPGLQLRWEGRPALH